MEIHSTHSLENIAAVAETEKDPEPNLAPDGGYGWVIVACCFFVVSIISFNFMSYGIFIGQFRDTFGWSESELGLLGSLRLGLGMFIGNECYRDGSLMHCQTHVHT